jgi:hypothetical protein
LLACGIVTANVVFVSGLHTIPSCTKSANVILDLSETLRGEPD